MDTLQSEKKIINAGKALKILEKRGMRLTPENAWLVIDFLYMLAEIIYKQQQPEV